VRTARVFLPGPVNGAGDTDFALVDNEDRLVPVPLPEDALTDANFAVPILRHASQHSAVFIVLEEPPPASSDRCSPDEVDARGEWN